MIFKITKLTDFFVFSKSHRYQFFQKKYQNHVIFVTFSNVRTMLIKIIAKKATKTELMLPKNWTVSMTQSLEMKKEC